MQQAWYASSNQRPWWRYALAPLSCLFWLISSSRKACYRFGILKAYKSALPVVVVGNISVGGNGKTPVVLALIEHFAKLGVKCAVLSRGYGAKLKDYPYMLSSHDSASEVGDEPALIFQRTGVTVVIDPVRGRGAKHIEANTDAHIILCDDGMQHYALQRDVEICVMDARGIGNGYLLPMGPLRETSSRLKSVDYLVYNGPDASQHECLRTLMLRLSHMTLAPSRWVNVHSGEALSVKEGCTYFAKAKSIAALAAIGNPQRFFDSLVSFNIALGQTIELPDHFDIQSKNIPDAEIVLMTEKDAVKCRHFAPSNCWYLEVEAMLSESIYRYIESRVQQLKDGVTT